MSIDLSQKNIDQYLTGQNISDENKETAIVAITQLVYARNQSAIKAEEEKDTAKKEQFVRSVKEYDGMIKDKISSVVSGKNTETYDF